MKIKIIIEELFYALTFLLIILSGLEFFWSRSVLGYLNLNTILIIWLISGIVNVAIKEKKYEK